LDHKLLERAVTGLERMIEAKRAMLDEAEAAHRTEASLRTEHERYARAILDLNQEFALRQTSFAPSIRGE
jgi:hypothetical protein